MLREKSRKFFCMSFCLIFIFLLMVINFSRASEQESGKIEFKPKTIAVFKNGIGFFIFEGEAEIKGEKVIAEFVPEAALGTFWLASLDPDTTITQAIATKEKTTFEKPALSIKELLRANVGKEIICYVPEQEPIIGKLIYCPEDELPEIIPFPTDTPHYPPPLALPPRISQLIIIESEEGQVAVDPLKIERVEFPSSPTTATKQTEDKKKIYIYLRSKKATTPLRMSFLQKGIAWFPSYNVDIADEKKARITLQALLVNDAFDIDEAETYFIVGYPNIKYAHLLSPFALQQALAQIINLIAQPPAQPRLMKGIMAQMAAPLEETGITGYSATAFPGVEGVFEGDLFFYHLPKVTLKKFQRGYYNLFSDAVDYKNIYSWEIPRTVPETYYQQQETPEEPDEVWHSIKLRNTTQYPWTTAPAFVTRGWRPMGQDELKYTPKGDEMNLRITQAVDVKVNRKESELEREKGVQLYGITYDLIKVKGELTSKNFKNKSIEMEVTKNLIGKVLETSPAGEVTERAEALRAANPVSEIKWKFTLEPDEEKTLTYVFQIYVRH